MGAIWALTSDVSLAFFSKILNICQMIFWVYIVWQSLVHRRKMDCFMLGRCSAAMFSDSNMAMAMMKKNLSMIVPLVQGSANWIICIILIVLFIYINILYFFPGDTYICMGELLLFRFRCRYVYATVIPAVFKWHSMFIFLYLLHDAVRTSKLINEV